MLLIASVVSFIICSYKGDVWEEQMRSILYKAKGDSIPNFATEKLDANGVPFVYYAPQNNIAAGTQYNATIVANYAIEYYHKFSLTKDVAQLNHFNNCIEWLQNNITYINNVGLYYFNWQQPWYIQVKGKFTSGITSGRAIEAFTLKFKQSNDSSYLALAKQLVRGYYLPIEQGGFTYQTTNGWWFEEIADTNLQTPKILDGHIFAILGAQQYWELTKDDSAKTIVHKGLQALKHELSNYDGGKGIIFYDRYKKQADKKYQRILVNQIQEIWQLTEDDFYKKYYEQWNAPLAKNYMLRIVQEQNISGLILYAFVTLLIGFNCLLLYRISLAKFNWNTDNAD